MEVFISKNFFPNHNPQNKISYLFPEGNIERCKYGFNPEYEIQYEKLASELNDLVFSIEAEYEIYRKTIKDKLLI